MFQKFQSVKVLVIPKHHKLKDIEIPICWKFLYWNSDVSETPIHEKDILEFCSAGYSDVEVVKFQYVRTPNTSDIPICKNSVSYDMLEIPVSEFKKSDTLEIPIYQNSENSNMSQIPIVGILQIFVRILAIPIHHNSTKSDTSRNSNLILFCSCNVLSFC